LHPTAPTTGSSTSSRRKDRTRLMRAFTMATPPLANPALAIDPALTEWD
jgi:hypothetical protein